MKGGLKKYWVPLLFLLVVLTMVLFVPGYIALFVWSDGPCYGCR